MVTPQRLDFGGVRLGAIGILTIDIQNYDQTRDVIVDVDVGGGGGAFYINTAHKRIVIEHLRFSRLKVRFDPSRLDFVATAIIRGSLTLTAAPVPLEGAKSLSPDSPVALLHGAIARGASLIGQVEIA
jgi:hypothetical protein